MLTQKKKRRGWMVSVARIAGRGGDEDEGGESKDWVFVLERAVRWLEKTGAGEGRRSTSAVRIEDVTACFEIIPVLDGEGAALEKFVDETRAIRDKGGGFHQDAEDHRWPAISTRWTARLG